MVLDRFGHVWPLVSGSVINAQLGQAVDNSGYSIGGHGSTGAAAQNGDESTVTDSVGCSLDELCQPDMTIPG